MTPEDRALLTDLRAAGMYGEAHDLQVALDHADRTAALPEHLRDPDPMFADARRRHKLTVEELNALPVGAVVGTKDGWRTYRLHGHTKNDWDRVFRNGHGWQVASDSPRGQRNFFELTLMLRNRQEALFLLDFA